MTGKTTIAAMLASVALLTMPAFAQTTEAPADAGADAAAAAASGDSAANASEAGASQDATSQDAAGKDWHGKMRHHGKRDGKMRVAPPFFAQFDSDGDGTISADEVEAAATQLIEKYGSDGAMDVDQFETMMADISRPSIERAFKHLDANGDGKLDESEAGDSAKRFVGAKIWQPKDRATKAAPDAGASDATATTPEAEAPAAD